jgi:hypothetical protein
VREGLLELHPPPELEFGEKLRQQYPTLLDVHVELDRGAACLRAARIIADEIQAFLEGPRHEFCVANAGGRNIRDTINELQRLVPVPPPQNKKRITFLSLNAAETNDSFDECSNFHSVRLAQIYGKKHFAVIKNCDQETAQRYHDAIQNVDLLISSAGGRTGFLATWLNARDEALPPGAIGDFAFHPIDERGQPVDDPEAIMKLIDEGLLRAPPWHDLVPLLLANKVLLILTGDKADIGRALLANGLVKRCVLDREVAGALCRDAKQKTAPDDATS